MKYFYKFLAFVALLTLGAGSTLAYSDVSVDHWFYLPVERLRDMGIVDDAEFFHPARELERAEMVKMVMIANDGLEGYETPYAAAFFDVPLDAWSSDYVEAAATAKIVTGFMDDNGNFTGYFGPSEIVTRAQAVKVLIEAFELNAPLNGSESFADTPNDKWFYTYVEKARILGIVEGFEDGNFKPHDPVTRSQMAKMLSIAIDLWQESQLEEVPEVEEEDSEDETPTETPDPDDDNEAETPVDENGDEMMFEPNSDILRTGVALFGEEEKYVAEVDFSAIYEDIIIDDLTIGNYPDDQMDETGVVNDAIESITLKFADKDGYLKVVEKPFSLDGTVKFSSLDLWVDRDTGGTLEIYATFGDATSLNAATSGALIQIGLQTENNDSGSFSAIGASSNNPYDLEFASGLKVSNSETNLHVIKQSKPLFEVENESQNLNNGDADLIELNITADERGDSLTLARMVFQVSMGDDDGANLELSDFTFKKDNSSIDEVIIYDATGGQDLSSNGGGVLTDGLHHVIVSFDEAEFIGSGDTENYSLSATVSGSSSDDSVNTSLEDDSDSLTGLTDSNQESTGQVFVNGDVTAGIFTASDTDFSQLLGTDLNFIWSDQSLNDHSYPNVNTGVVDSGTGSADWTNGFYLRINALASSLLSK